MERYIDIGGSEVIFKASGATPRIYRGVCGRDLLTDLIKLDTGDYTPDVLQIYEDLAYTMAKQGNDTLGDKKDNNFPKSPDEWLDTIEALDIYDVLPQIAQLWRTSQKTTVSAKKKND